MCDENTTFLPPFFFDCDLQIEIYFICSSFLLFCYKYYNIELNSLLICKQLFNSFSLVETASRVFEDSSSIHCA